VSPIRRRDKKSAADEGPFAIALPSRIVLTGFMGAGKSAVGRRLAEIVRRPFIDLDRAIESAEGTKVAEIINRRGEAAFRAIERREAARVARLPNTIVATGGGTLLDKENRDPLLAGDARVIVLTASLEELVRRLAADPAARPLLGGADLRERVAALFAERAPAYAALGEVVDTTGKTVEESVREVLGRIAPAAVEALDALAARPAGAREPSRDAAAGEVGEAGEAGEVEVADADADARNAEVERDAELSRGLRGLDASDPT
jgi:shikimate kinase